MSIETSLVYLSALVFAEACSRLPFIKKVRGHFYTPESDKIQEWAYLTDAVFTRTFLTGLLGAVALYLGAVITKGLHMKGVSAGICDGFRIGTFVMTVGVLVVGVVGALRMRRGAVKLLQDNALQPPERESVWLRIVLFLLVAAGYVPAMQGGLSWLSQ